MITLVYALCTPITASLPPPPNDPYPPHVVLYSCSCSLPSHPSLIAQFSRILVLFFFFCFLFCTYRPIQSVMNLVVHPQSPPESVSPIPTVTLSFYHSLSSHLDPDSLFSLFYFSSIMIQLFPSTLYTSSISISSLTPAFFFLLLSFAHSSPVSFRYPVQST
jgi:hypothetical protein